MIIFDVSKKQKHLSDKFKRLCRKLRSFTSVEFNEESFTSDRLSDCELLVIVSPQSPFEDEELCILKDYVDGGGSLAVFSCDGESQAPESNLNRLLSDYGISVENSTVVRAVYHTYLHPKHALIQNGIVQPEIGVEKHVPLNATSRSRHQQNTTPEVVGLEPSMSLTFVYPYGTTLSVQSPAYTLLSSGSTSYPVDCPIAATWESTDISGEQGRVLVMGSSDMFADDWLDKEENEQLCDVLFRFLLCQNVTFDPSMGRSDFEERECVPDISSLSHMVKPCLQENKPLPQDHKSLLCEDLFGVTNDLIPDVIDLYQKLNVKYEPLTLVEPDFVCPTPPLRLATHQPRMADCPPPALELFDLDEAFSDVNVRVAEVANRFADDASLDDFVQEVGWVLGFTEKMSKEILYQIGTQIFEFKMRTRSAEAVF